jgi:hypothetical protein
VATHWCRPRRRTGPIVRDHGLGGDIVARQVRRFEVVFQASDREPKFDFKRLKGHHGFGRAVTATGDDQLLKTFKLARLDRSSVLSWCMGDLPGNRYEMKSKELYQMIAQLDTLQNPSG